MAQFGSKSSGNTSECVGVDARTCGCPVRGKIKLGTRKNASIRVNFDVGRSWGHIYTVLQCVAPNWARNSAETCWNALGSKLEGFQHKIEGFHKGLRAGDKGDASFHCNTAIFTIFVNPAHPTPSKTPIRCFPLSITSFRPCFGAASGSTLV